MTAVKQKIYPFFPTLGAHSLKNLVGLDKMSPPASTVNVDGVPVPTAPIKYGSIVHLYEMLSTGNDRVIPVFNDQANLGFQIIEIQMGDLSGLIVLELSEHQEASFKASADHALQRSEKVFLQANTAFSFELNSTQQMLGKNQTFEEMFQVKAKLGLAPEDDYSLFLWLDFSGLFILNSNPTLVVSAKKPVFNGLTINRAPAGRDTISGVSMLFDFTPLGYFPTLEAVADIKVEEPLPETENNDDSSDTIAPLEN